MLILLRYLLKSEPMTLSVLLPSGPLPLLADLVEIRDAAGAEPLRLRIDAVVPRRPEDEADWETKHWRTGMSGTNPKVHSFELMPSHIDVDDEVEHDQLFECFCEILAQAGNA